MIISKPQEQGNINKNNVKTKKIEAYEIMGNFYSSGPLKDHEKALKCFKKILE